MSIFIPTLNAGERLDEVLAALKEQEAEFSFEILATDSGSGDGTLERLESAGVEVDVIEQRDFDHGATRNTVLKRARGELIAFLSQDATPADRHWLRSLAAPFADEAVTATYARQQPREDIHPFMAPSQQRHLERQHSDRRQEPLSAKEWQEASPLERLDRIRFDNVSSMIRRSALERRPFEQGMFGEDLRWARAALLDGETIVFAAEAVVHHSHALSRHEMFDRVETQHALMRELADFRPIPSAALLLRRSLGTTLRFWKALARDASLSLPARFCWGLRAPCWAWRQMRAMRRGAESAAYSPPSSSA